MNVRFLPIVDHLSYIERMTQTHNITDETLKNNKCVITEFINKNNISFIINQHIYIPYTKNGVPIDKSLRLKVGGTLYKQLMKIGNGKLPKLIIENDGKI